MGKNSNYDGTFRNIARPLILARDTYKCLLCGYQSTANHVHHIDKDTTNLSPCNLITLCKECHKAAAKIKFYHCQSARGFFEDEKNAFTPSRTCLNPNLEGGVSIWCRSLVLALALVSVK